jgi:hypothetical protein
MVCIGYWKGKHLSKIHRKAISVGMLARHLHRNFSKRHNKNLSIAIQKSFANGRINGMKGKHRSKFSIEKSRLSLSKLYANGYVHPMRGKHFSAKVRHNMSLARLGTHPSEATKVKFRNRIISKATRKKISVTMTGRFVSRITRKKMSLTWKKRIKAGYVNHFKGCHFSKKHRKNMSLSAIGKIKSEKHLKAILRANCRRPNNKEKCLDSILQKNFPNEWKYVGRGDFFLGGKNPDFMNVNGKKLLIEMYGDYFHRGETGEDRIAHFRQFGFDTIVIWEHELRDENRVVNRIENFIEGRVNEKQKV